MKINLDVPDDLIRNYVERARISYWGDAEWSDRDALVLAVTEHDEPMRVLGPAEWAAGLALLARSFPRQWGELVTDDGDMYTGDLLIQCAAFGEEKYC